MEPKHAPEQTLPAKTGEVKAAISRREFARRAAFVTASAATIPVVLLGESRDLPERIESGSSQERQNPAPASQMSASESEVENKFENILSQYGSRFSDEQRADIRRLVGETQKQLDRLRAYSLDNSDQPATMLKPLMERNTRPPAIATKHSQAAAPVRPQTAAKPNKRKK
jgi:hypothetical protein